MPWVRQNEEQGALAVQGSEHKTRVCDRCFAHVPEDMPSCPECGATLGNPNALGNSDSDIYPELARANLLRMRSDYGSAEALCLSILKRYPNNATVHTLLGDICAEQGDLEQAVQWYELALDLDPQSTTDRAKMLAVRERIRQRDTAAGAEQLGLPDRNANVPVLAILAVAILAMVALGSYFIGAGYKAKESASRVIDTPIDAPKSESAVPAPPSPQTPLLKMHESSADHDFGVQVAQKSAQPVSILEVTSDPRNRAITITYAAGANEDEKRLGAEVARTALDLSQETLTITVRAIREDALIYMADATRAHYQTIDPTAGDSWVTHLMSNEWPGTRSTPAPGTAVDPSSTPPDATTTGTR